MEPVHRQFPKLLGKTLLPRLAVILGDPQLPDPCKPGGKFVPQDLDDLKALRTALASLTQYQITYLTNHQTLWDDLRRLQPDLVLNFCDNGFHNRPAQELHVPAMLEVLGLAYTGAPPSTLVFCYDKAAVSAHAQRLGVPTPHEQLLLAGKPYDLTAWSVYPAFVKLRASDNSIGLDEQDLVIAETPAELQRCVNAKRRAFPQADLLVQEFLPGLEYRAQIFGNKASGFMFSPPGVWRLGGDDKARFLSYSYKFGLLPDDRASRYAEATPAEALADPARAVIEGYCQQLVDTLRCFDYASVEFRTAADGTMKLMEVNPNTSWELGSLLGEEDEAEGFFYADALQFILESAEIRYLGNAAHTLKVA
ncbi:MAG: D-alanine--D-alanine ligase [Alphaproteobacteria bacterium]|jgi:D-alanine-D-alanine ligase|nr:D-alanine--D-alanine ligase [Thalassospira sp.]MCE2964776.1 D-alanine--D-alanine ligase [Alphaproteobacteria bacterium]